MTKPASPIGNVIFWSKAFPLGKLLIFVAARAANTEFHIPDRPLTTQLADSVGARPFGYEPATSQPITGSAVRPALLSDAAVQFCRLQHTWQHTGDRMRFGRWILLLVAVLTSALLYAQTETTGEVAGTVTDPTGASVGNGTVTVKSDVNGETQTAATSTEGR